MKDNSFCHKLGYIPTPVAFIILHTLLKFLGQTFGLVAIFNCVDPNFTYSLKN